MTLVSGRGNNEMCDKTRNNFVAKLNVAREELKTAGPIHRKDLLRHIRRMERELRDYDRFHKEAEMRGRNAKGTAS